MADQVTVTDQVTTAAQSGFEAFQEIYKRYHSPNGDERFHNNTLKCAFLSAVEAVFRKVAESSGTRSLDSAFEYVKQMIREGHVHRTKRYSLGMSFANAMEHLHEEVKELDECGTIPEAKPEVADVLGVLFHLAACFHDSPQSLATRLLDKLRERFEVPGDRPTITDEQRAKIAEQTRSEFRFQYAARINELKTKAAGSRFMGKLIEECDRDELLAAIGAAREQAGKNIAPPKYDVTNSIDEQMRRPVDSPPEIKSPADWDKLLDEIERRQRERARKRCNGPSDSVSITYKDGQTINVIYGDGETTLPIGFYIGCDDTDRGTIFESTSRGETVARKGCRYILAEQLFPFEQRHTMSESRANERARQDQFAASIWPMERTAPEA